MCLKRATIKCKQGKCADCQWYDTDLADDLALIAVSSKYHISPIEGGLMTQNAAFVDTLYIVHQVITKEEARIAEEAREENKHG